MAISKAEKAITRKLDELDEQIASFERSLEKLQIERLALLQVAEDAGVIRFATADGNDD